MKITSKYKANDSVCGINQPVTHTVIEEYTGLDKNGIRRILIEMTDPYLNDNKEPCIPSEQDIIDQIEYLTKRFGYSPIPNEVEKRLAESKEAFRVYRDLMDFLDIPHGDRDVTLTVHRSNEHDSEDSITISNLD